MAKTLLKQIARRLVWSAKKKATFQILRSRCRQDGLAEYGHFTDKEIQQILAQAELNIKELMPCFIDIDSLGNYVNEYGGLVDLAVYRALVKAEVEPGYAMNLVGDMIWQARMNAGGVLPIIDPLRIRLAKMTTKDRLAFMERRLKDGMNYPYSEPGYKIEFYRDGDVYCMDIYTCPVYDFYKQFGREEMTLFRRTWCTFDYSVAQVLVEGGRYQREHTLSDGDEVCDMRWFIAGPSETTASPARID